MTPVEHALCFLDQSCPDSLLRAKLRALVRAYDQRWRNSNDFEVLEIERVATSHLYHPTTHVRSRYFYAAGKEDKLLRRDGRLWLMDHKTTSEDILDPASPYWRQLVIEAQHLHYALLEFLNGNRIEGAIWDVMRKPGISPRQIAKRELQMMQMAGTYYNSFVDPTDIEAALVTERETDSLYELRLYHDAAHLRPEWYFQRKPVARIDHEMLEYADELWGHAADILAARKQNRWPRNSGACMTYGRPCRFLGICSGFDSADSHNWRLKAWVHNELPVLDAGDGRNYLTNSRIREFQTCRRKHYFDYELAIERVEPEEVEALYFGTLWGKVLDHYYQQVILNQTKEHIDGNDNHTAQRSSTAHTATTA